MQRCLGDDSSSGIIDLIEHGVAVFSQTAPLSTGVFVGVFHNYRLTLLLHLQVIDHALNAADVAHDLLCPRPLLR